jgi:hypothetical protein
MDPEAAHKAFREYRGAFMAERNRIDGELMRGYKALAEGKTLIALTDAIQRGGVDDFGRPKLAISRADEAQIQMRRSRAGGIEYHPDFWRSNARSADRVFNLPDDTLPALTPEQETRKTSATRFADTAWNQRWTATLPFIPPQYRPPHGLVNYHLLWEAEWRLARGSQRRDPMLLKRIGGDLFAVVAAWDLTPIEKLVLAR